jgi:hypothetical protein
MAPANCPAPPSKIDILTFLSSRYPSRNLNKVRGVVAEIEFGGHIESLAANRLVRGGWIFEPPTPGFCLSRVALFPAHFNAPVAPPPPALQAALYLRQANLRVLYCLPSSSGSLNCSSDAGDLSGPAPLPPIPLSEEFEAYPGRRRVYRPPKFTSDLSALATAPSNELESLFARESLLESLRTDYMVSGNDLDFLLWGKSTIYPVEVKEKTVRSDDAMGDYFGLDVGPFTRLASFSEYGGWMHSLFVVREVSDDPERRFKQWWYCRLDSLCRHSSWVFRGGGKNMGGGRSAVARVPIAAFHPLDLAALNALRRSTRTQTRFAAASGSD